MILLEDNFEIKTEAITEGDAKKLYLRGVFMEAGKKNQNGRVYKTEEIKRAADFINEAANNNRHVLGELDHRDSLDVRLENVSHKILDVKMEGNQAVGNAVVLATPKGKIAESLILSGVNVGVSTRGSGSVNESTGEVENFNIATIDVVANPSCVSAVPNSVWESLQMYHNGSEINKLAEAVLHDTKAQKYFQHEMKKFIQDCFQAHKK